MHDDPNAPLPEDDDATLRRKLLTGYGDVGRQKMEHLLHDPEFLAAVRRSAAIDRERAARPQGPRAKPAWFNTAEFQHALAIFEGKIIVSRGAEPEASEKPDATSTAKSGAPLALVRDVAVADSGIIAKPIAATGRDATTQPIASAKPRANATVVGLGALGEAPRAVVVHGAEHVRGTTTAVAIASTVQQPVARHLDPSDTDVTHPGGRYADDPRAQQHRLQQTDRMAAIAAPTASPKRVPAVTKRMPADAAAASVTVDMERATARADTSPAAAVPRASSHRRSWAFAIAVLVVLVLVGVARVGRNDAPVPPTNATAPSGRASTAPVVPASAEGSPTSAGGLPASPSAASSATSAPMAPAETTGDAPSGTEKPPSVRTMARPPTKPSAAPAATGAAAPTPPAATTPSGWIR